MKSKGLAQREVLKVGLTFIFLSYCQNILFEMDLCPLVREIFLLPKKGTAMIMLRIYASPESNYVNFKQKISKPVHQLALHL